MNVNHIKGQVLFTKEMIENSRLNLFDLLEIQLSQKYGHGSMVWYAFKHYEDFTEVLYCSANYRPGNKYLAALREEGYKLRYPIYDVQLYPDTNIPGPYKS